VSAWPIEPSVGIPVVIAATLYIRGWGRLRRRLPRRFELRHAAVFLAGLVTMLLALASPVDALTHRWLSAHMVQHLLLMVVIPPMLWMGARWFRWSWACPARSAGWFSQRRGLRSAGA